MKNVFFFLIAFVALVSTTQAQRVAIGAGSPTPDASSVLDLQATDKGFLVPRVANPASIPSPATGLLLYNTTTNIFNFYNGTAWTEVGATGPAGPAGPTGLLSSGSAAGNTPFWNGSTWVVNSSNIFNNGGNVGIGAVPGVKLDVFNSSNSTVYSEAGRFRIANNAAGTNYSNLLLGQVATNKMFIEAADQSNVKGDLLLQPYGGNVGIGTSLPSAKLDVNGTIVATGVQAPGLTLQTVYRIITDVTTATVFNTYTDGVGTDLAITAKRNNSIFKITVIANGFYVGVSGCGVNIGIKYVGTNTLISGANGTLGDTWMGAGNGPPFGSYSITRTTFHNHGTVAGSTYTYRAMLGLWNNGTGYINFPTYDASSTIEIQEIAQ